METMNISIEGVEEKLDTIVKTHVANALGGEGEFLTRLVRSVCEQKQNKGGRVVSNLEYEIEKIVEGYIHEAIREEMYSREEELKTSIRRQLREKHAELIKQFAAATLEIKPSDSLGSQVVVEVQVQS